MAASAKKNACPLTMLIPLSTLLVVIILLEGGYRLKLLPVFLPGPSQIVHQMVQNPRLISDNLPPTLWRALEGFAISTGVTALAAGLTAIIRAARSATYNLGITLNAIPVIATAPLLAMWLGTGPSLQVVIAALACQFPILVGILQGMEASNSQQRELFLALSVTRLQLFRYLLLPNALPFIFAGLKIAAPAAVLGTVTAEWAGADRGIGAMMLYALFSYDIVTVWVSVILTCLLAAAAYGLCAILEKRVVFWTRLDIDR